MFYSNHSEQSSFAEVAVWAVRAACIKYVAVNLEDAKITRERLIEEAMTGWFGAKTREKAIARLNKDTWDYGWHYYKENAMQYRLNARVKGLLALCELSMNGRVSLNEKDAQLVSNYKDK